MKDEQDYDERPAKANFSRSLRARARQAQAKFRHLGTREFPFGAPLIVIASFVQLSAVRACLCVIHINEEMQANIV